MKRFSSKLPSHTNGFSLIELMVAIGIIAVLAAILIPTLGRSVAQARSAATIATLKKVQEMLNQRREEFLLGTLDNKLYPHKNTTGVSSDDGINLIYARKIWAKGAFPQRFEDLVGADGVAGTFDLRHNQSFDDDSDGNADIDSSFNWFVDGTAVPWGRIDVKEFGIDNAGPSSSFSDDVPLGTILRNMIASGQFVPAKHTPATESSELLYLALTQSTSFGSKSVDSGDFRSAEIGDTDNDGLLEILDGWGNPIRFYRWPTCLLRPYVPGSSPFQRDTTAGDYRPYQFASGSCWSLISTTPMDLGLASKDPDDPLNKTAVAGLQGRYTRNGVSNVPSFHEGDSNVTDAVFVGDNLTPEFTFHSPQTYHSFLLMSCGVDGELGLYEPYDVTNYGHLGQPLPATLTNPGDSPLVDNLTNLRLEVK